LVVYIFKLKKILNYFNNSSTGGDRRISARSGMRSVQRSSPIPWTDAGADIPKSVRTLGHSGDQDPITVVRDEGNLVPVKGKSMLVGPPTGGEGCRPRRGGRIPDLGMTVPGSPRLL
jgi:hypothetical protein